MMQRKSHTTDQNGFDFMANTGREEQNRDTLGIVFSLVIIAVITLSQYLGML
ncbi:hypothetical protein GO013_10455 [Pseudodesulfovibrio sp. JC047]|uniref:hypothetical protein n=1 Tax=Pseudodesulfovibrio sp. JC047 TaxID=2683199 RepID=UPI001406D2CB|nr:hypothetical protein [Pseudodesulfovibrio sp. JC047]NDV19841.1 hypothetical protein [Pseudodesulfovibrio sp. JC047]